MKRLFYFLLTPALVLSFGSLCEAQSCKIETIAMQAKIKAAPGSVLKTLQQSLALRPGCVGELVEAAIVAADPDPSTLGQIVKLAVFEYPSKSGEIAEAAVMAAPDQVDLIRKTFVAAQEQAAEKKKRQPETPLEKFLAAQKKNDQTFSEQIIDVALQEIPSAEEVIRAVPAEVSVETGFSFPSPPAPDESEDIAVQALKKIDAMLAKLRGKTESKPQASVEEVKTTIPDGEIPLTTLNDTTPRVSGEEMIDSEKEESLVINDQALESTVDQ